MENAFCIINLNLLRSFLTVVSLHQLSVIMVHLRGFGRPFVSKHLVCCCKPSSFFMVKPGSMDYSPYSPDLAVTDFYFLDHLRSAWLANDVWLTPTRCSHLLSVDTRIQFLGPRDTRLGAMLAQTLKCQWWRRHELMYANCCSCAVCEYIEVRMKFSASGLF